MPRPQNESFCNFICTFVVMQIKVITHTDACSVNRFARGPVLKQRQKAIREWSFFFGVSVSLASSSASFCIFSFIFIPRKASASGNSLLFRFFRVGEVACTCTQAVIKVSLCKEELSQAFTMQESSSFSNPLLSLTSMYLENLLKLANVHKRIRAM